MGTTASKMIIEYHNKISFFKRISIKKKKINNIINNIKRSVKEFRIFNVCENKFEFKNQRHKITLLAAPLLASNKAHFAINRALLTVYAKFVLLRENFAMLTPNVLLVKFMDCVLDFRIQIYLLHICITFYALFYAD